MRKTLMAVLLAAPLMALSLVASAADPVVPPQRPAPAAAAGSFDLEIDIDAPSMFERTRVHELLERQLDEVAYVRFASVYRQFKDINTFRDELNKLLHD